MCVYIVFVCVRERERERVCVCMYIYTHTSHTHITHTHTHTYRGERGEREARGDARGDLGTGDICEGLGLLGVLGRRDL